MIDNSKQSIMEPTFLTDHELNPERVYLVNDCKLNVINIRHGPKILNYTMWHHIYSTKSNQIQRKAFLMCGPSEKNSHG